MSRLTHMNLGLNSIEDDAAVVAIARSLHMSNLKTLWLAQNSIGDEAAIALATSPHMSNPKTLNLLDNPIGIPGQEALAVSKFLREAIRKKWR